MSSEPLQEAYRLIREGKKQEASRILVPYVRADPLNADAWWLLANAVDNAEPKRHALERVIKLRPTDERARRMLAELPPAPVSVKPIPMPKQTIAEFPADEEGYDPFEGDGNVRVRPPRKNGILTLILGLIAVLTILSCGVCILAFAVSGSAIQVAVSQIILTVTFEPNLAALGQIGTPVAPPATLPPTLPTDLQMRGSVASGQTVNNTVDTFQDDGWTFSADKNQHVIIELDATDRSLDPHLYLYAPDGSFVADNDDIDGTANRNSRIEVTLTVPGTYTIRVSKFNGGGAYTLTLG